MLSSKTAKALKNAGFPQPKPEPGQFWYSPQDELFVIQQDEGEDGICGAYIGTDGGFNEPILDEDVFCPNATDILPLLTREFILSKPKDRETWFCEDVERGNYWQNVDADEAAAKTFLEYSKE